MGRSITMYDLLLSCPGDAYEECYPAVCSAITEFNKDAQTNFSIGVSLKHWSTDSYPQSGGKAQDLLNSQIVDCVDVAIVIFWTRFGTPTDKYGSGTEEEINRLMSSNKQVFLYFFDKPVPPSITDFPDYHEHRKKIATLKKNYTGIYSVANNEKQLEEKILQHLKKYFFNRDINNSSITNKWFRSDTGKEISPNELLNYGNTTTQIDGDIARVEVIKPDSKSIYAEMNISKNEIRNIVADGYPQEYTIDIPNTLIINKQCEMILVNNITYRNEKYVLKFGGYLSVLYDNVSNKVQDIGAKAPASMSMFVDTINKKVRIVDKNIISIDR